MDSLDMVIPLAVPPAPVAPAPAAPAATAPVATAPPAASAKGAPLQVVEQLMRQPQDFLLRLGEPDITALTRVLIGTLVLGAGLFGAVMGSYRGGLQVLYCAVKLPLLLLTTLVVCTPPFVALARATGTALPARSVIALTLGSCARFALVLAGLAPILWLSHGWFGYHAVILVIVAACVVAGSAAGSLLLSGLLRAPGAGWLAGLGFVTVFALVGAQTSWLLRPFVVRPRTEKVPFVRAIEGDLFDAVKMSARSAAGIYDRLEAPLRSMSCGDRPCE